MIVKSTIRANCFDGPRWKVIVDLGAELPQLQIEPQEARKIEKVIAHLKRNQKAYTMAVVALAMLVDFTGTTHAAAAAGGMSGGKNIILLLQKASFWVGMGITIWGIVEAQLDFPGWKGRILKGILGYIGILLVPLIFLELQSSLQVDVWNQIDGAPAVPTTPHR
ncbi:hypothetical protein [Paenibacillus planticolens]|uniref:Uncharacterized protein n=1 Tax=Paenibacillus planticolens TaxID=2654976 RepID=A0ABX1ZMN8_9BACL|nr:hypothetical protein [Paenibacillus planticolens]NOV01322.1 hypothetical protein [Paenibacillus planticolens]